MSLWTDEEDSLYIFAKETAEEWWMIGSVDDRQYIALLKLLHVIHNHVYMEWRRRG